MLLMASLAATGLVRGESPPVEFGLREFRDALADKGLETKIRTEISTGAPETYRISSYLIQGGDLRGLMYGLLAAADQIRRLGRLTPERGSPEVPVRGVRRFLHNRDLEDGWYHDRDYWREYIQMLARNRFNRLNLVFGHQTAYLSPPYPYWFSLAEFPEVRAEGITGQQQERNLETLCYIAQTAADHAVDFTLGVWQHDIQHGRQTGSVEGLTEKNLGPYSHAALQRVLAACPAIRSLQIRTNWESGIPAERQVEFYRDYVFKALREVGRLVKLDLRGWLMGEGMLNAAIDSGVSLRLSSKYWAEHLGRPYQPAEIFPNYSYINFLRRRPELHGNRVRPYEFFWEIWTLGSHRLLLWGDPDYVKRVAGTLSLSETQGFEIDEPLAQKGYGNRPGEWGVFAATEREREFWKWEFERYWLFYRLWGRLTYNSRAPERIWLSEFERRYGEAAAEAAEAYRQASRTLNEIVAVHMPDPNMYMWPEINPGGLIDYYAAAPPSDQRLVASIEEAVQLRLDRTPSAKQMPRETAQRLAGTATAIREAMVAVDAKVPEDHREWRATRPDFEVLAHLAEFHSHRQIAAERLTYFYKTAAREALDTAMSEAARCAAIWEELVELTSGLYPPNMSFGPEDFGHWKDKLPYLRHDLETLREREWLLDRFGSFDFGFDFGAEPRRLGYRQFLHSSIEPRFAAVNPATLYSEETGFGWASEGERDAVALADASREILRATDRSPRSLPENALFGDHIRGQGAQTFRVRTGPGDFLVSLLYPEGNATFRQETANNGVVDAVLPAEEWEVSGILVKSVKPPPIPARLPEPDGDRPAFAHTVPRSFTPGRPLSLILRATPSADMTVRLHYRPLNAQEKFRTLEAPSASAAFTIPGEELTAEWDLLYYFEVVTETAAGWFHPDPDEQTPYYVVGPSAPAAPARR